MGSVWSGIVGAIFNYNTVKTVQIKCVPRITPSMEYILLYSHLAISHLLRLRAVHRQSQP